MRNPISYLSIREKRSDYWMQFEILVALIYSATVSAGDTVVDGGANAGLHTGPLARLVGPKGWVYAFEPNPQVYKVLVETLKAFPWCKIYQAALSNKRGEARFVINPEKSALSHIATSFEGNSDAITVSTVTLDDALSERPVSFIKLDLEGTDFLALRGATDVLLRDRPIVVFENSRAWAAKCYGYSAEEFFAYFTSIRYTTLDLHGTPVGPDQWDERNIAFELVAAPKGDPRLNRILALVENFWHSVDERDVLTSWQQCVSAIRHLSEYWSE